MTQTAAQRHAARSVLAYLRRLSIKRRITIAMLFAFLLTVPSVYLSLVYVSRILQEINTIIDQDVAMGRSAAELSVLMLDIRRIERNYRLIGGDTERNAVQSLIAVTDSALAHALTIAPKSEEVLISDMQSHLAMYANSFSMLADHISAHPPESRIQRIRNQLSDGLEAFQHQYRDTLEQLESAPPDLRDSLITQVSESMNVISFDRLMTTAGGDDSAQPAYIQDNLNRSAEDFLTAADDLAERSWQNMQAHRTESQFIEARAKRDIITILLITAAVCVYVVSSLPRKITRPVARLNGLLRKAGEGDFASHATVSTNDEIGDLANSYNQVLDRISQYDELKTRKIASQKRIIDRLLEHMARPACVFSSGMILLYYNAPFADLFDGAIPPRPPDMGIDAEKSETLKPFVEQLQQETANTGAEFGFMFTLPSGGEQRFNGRVVRNTLMKMESLILMGEDSPGATQP